MYMRLLIVFLLFQSCYLISNQKLVFKQQYLENKLYVTSIKIVAKTEVDYQGSQEIINQIKTMGMKIPMIIDQDQLTIMKVETFSKNENGFIPFSGRLDSVSVFRLINGEPSQQSISVFDTGFKMNGQYEENEMIIEKLHGQGIKPDLENTIKQAISQMVKSIKFPENPLKVGDKFSQSIPFSFQVPGNNRINMMITTQYQLKSISGRTAQFNITQEFELSSDTDPADMKLTGSGSGQMTYDRYLHQMTSMFTNSTMKMTIDMGNFQMISKSDTKTNMRIDVADKG